MAKHMKMKLKLLIETCDHHHLALLLFISSVPLLFFALYLLLFTFDVGQHSVDSSATQCQILHD